MRKPPMLETTRETSESMIVATPAKTRATAWNHMVSPSVTSSTPMISEPAPAVVAMATVSPPRLRCAYGKYAMGPRRGS